MEGKEAKREPKEAKREMSEEDNRPGNEMDEQRREKEGSNKLIKGKRGKKH